MGRPDDGFDEFYAAELRPLRRLAYLLTGSWTEAEELAQDAMERTFRAWTRIANSERPGAYARTVLVNRHRSILRRAVVEAKHSVARQPERADVPPDMAEDRVTLWNAVCSLPLRQRQAIVLRFYEDLSDGEIAAIMDCPVNTVRSLVHRGLGRLRASTGLAPGLATVGRESA